MNVLLINPPLRTHQPAYFPPVGLGIIAKVLHNDGHGVEIYDLNCLRYDEYKAIERLPINDYDLIGVSGIITTYSYLFFLVPVLREIYEDVPIVLGGGGFTSGYETYMEQLRPDYGVIGEGEYTLLELADCLEMGQSTRHIKGLTYYKDDELVVNPPRPLEQSLDNFPMIAYDLLDTASYSNVIKYGDGTVREASILATRGCPMSCTFCYHVFGRGVRYRSVEKVIDEMEYLIDEFQVGTFLFGDECMTARRSWIEEFCNTLIEREIKVGWICYSRVDTLKEETMAIMARAGCFMVGFGFESGSQKILDEMDKRTTVEKAYETATKAKKYFRVGGTFIYGMPGEDDESIEDNISFCKSVRIPRSFFFLAPYPGTKVYYDNMDKILAKFGSLHHFFYALGNKDAGELVINLTNWSDKEFGVKKFVMDAKIKLAVAIEKRKYRGATV